MVITDVGGSTWCARTGDDANKPDHKYSGGDKQAVKYMQKRLEYQHKYKLALKDAEEKISKHPERFPQVESTVYPPLPGFGAGTFLCDWSITLALCDNATPERHNPWDNIGGTQLLVTTPV